ncbi:CLUMA_CG008749, isoform A [Clunio marinus]|uniref:CLUMA_CG008749, isoform A n=1 Tax=Clunio marinus TaxID=568069 RepID=A0A1J1I526_9DIPT|nr:CLUMA_CG008749, isoform A [Clunio marinus]
MKSLRKRDLNVKVVLEDIFSDFKNIHQKCRLCFKEVYNQEPKIYLTNDMISRMHDVFQVNMSLDGTGSEFVCSKCENNLNILYQFRVQMKGKQKCYEKFRSMKIDDTDERLASIHENSIKIEVEEATCQLEDENQILKSQVINKKSQQLFPCDVCGKKFKNVVGVQRHCRREHSNSRYGAALPTNKRKEHKSKNFQCQICKKNFYHKKKLNSHIYNCREDRKKISCTSCKRPFQSERNLKVHFCSYSKFVCDTCGKRFNNRHSLTEHIDTHRKYRTRDYHCDICKTSYYNKAGFRLHISRCHEERKFSCVSCRKTFKLERTLKSHVCNNSTFVCDICGKSFHRRGEVFDHMIKHRKYKTRDYQCFICENSYPRKKSLNSHLFQCHEIKKFFCYLCKKAFKSERKLKSHNCGKYTFVCDFCGKRIQKKINVALHMNRHRKHRSKDFQCHICKSSYLHKVTLQHHIIKIHDDKKICCTSCKQVFMSEESLKAHDCCYFKFVCDICGKRFNNRYCLAAHIETHRKYRTKDYHCDICKTSFYNQAGFRLHRSKYHEERKFSCVSCRKTFKLERKLKSHICSIPKFVCDICGKRFNNRHSLTEHIDTHRKYRTRDYHCDICKTSYYNQAGFRLHISRYHEERKFSCASCRKIFMFEKNLKSHNCSNSTFVCDICGKSFHRRGEVINHMIKHRKYKTRDYQCFICENSYTRKQSLNLHLFQSHENKKFFCYFCKKAFKSERKLKSHICGNSTFVCDFCGKRIQKKINVALHMNKHKKHRSKDFQCHICKSSYLHKVTLQRHIIKIHDDTKFCCTSCKQVFMSEESLKSHDCCYFKFVCDICGKRSHNRNSLARHIDTHRKYRTKDYHCDICKTSFFNKFGLHRHVSEFHEERKFSCASCRKSFTLERSLKSHVCSTTFVCDACDKRFYSRSKLTNHIDMHRKYRTRDYHCDICKTSYYNKAGLQTHVSKYHEERKFSCTSCRKTFKLEHYLKSHNCSI